MKQLPHIIAVVGPTASGKSDFAVKLALEKNGEVISADSRQIYRGLDIGTGKITKEEMRGVVHHMLDIKDPSETYSVVEYVDMVLPIISDILNRGKTPILCGGTGQYIYATLYTQSFPKIEKNEILRNELEKKSTEELFALLEDKDPTRAATIDKHNKVRLVRALEIIQTLSAVPKETKVRARFNATIYTTNPDNETLRKRIIARLEKRLNEGMVKEVELLLTKNFSEQKLKTLGIEYVYIAQYLHKKISYEEMKNILIAKTWQYAKRQKTWNKKYFKDAIMVN